MSIQDYIENTVMGIDFSDLEKKDVEELRGLTEKYRKTYYNYKHEIYPKHNETITVFGDYPYIYVENTKKINVKFIYTYRKQLMENYLSAMEMGKKKSRIEAEKNQLASKRKYYELNQDKLKEQMRERYYKQKELHKEKIVCNICQHTYTFSNKSKHCLTVRHKNALEQNNEM
jgi:hypothetical protein